MVRNNAYYADALTPNEIGTHHMNPGHPNFRNWALQPVPTMQVGAAALGYPDSLKMTKRHELPPTVIANEFTAAGVTQDCADDLARIINDAFAGMWPERKEYLNPNGVPVIAVIMISFMSALFILVPWIPMIIAGVPYMLFAYVVFLPMVGGFWFGIYASTGKIMGPRFELGIKALENAQPALRECLARHGVNGTVRPAREMEGLGVVTLCSKSIARFWVRLEVVTGNTNPDAVRAFSAGMPPVPQFYTNFFSRSALTSYETSMNVVRQMMGLATGICNADMNAVSAQLQTPSAPQMTAAPVSTPVQAPVCTYQLPSCTNNGEDTTAWM